MLKSSICIVGSLRFYALMLDVHKVFENAGISCSVPTPGKFRNPKDPGEYINGYSRVPFREKVEEERKRVDDYLKRVRLSDTIYIVNPDGYVGLNTVGEIYCAHENKKLIYALEPFHEDHDLFLRGFVEDFLPPKDLVKVLLKAEEPPLASAGLFKERLPPHVSVTGL